MRWIKSIGNQLHSMFHRNAAECELDQELKFHVERRLAENMAAGMPPEEARREALFEFGGVEEYKEECREGRGIEQFESLLADLRYAFQSYEKAPATRF